MFFTGRWFERILGHWSQPLVLATLIGVVAGLAAAALEWGLHVGTDLLIGRFQPPATDPLFFFRWEILLFPAAGGLVSGLFVHWFAPDSLGHGADALTHAFHRRQGEMPLRGPVVKATASVAVISSGGSAGPEGPIAALGAGIGSSLGRWLQVTPRQRRMLLIAGCAAGVGAMFRCPLGGALFAAGIMYSEPEFESEAIVPSVVASVVSYSVMVLTWGSGEPLLREAADLKFYSPLDLIAYGILGALCGLVSIWLFACFAFVQKYLAASPHLPRWLPPAIGGLATGAIACLVPTVLGGRFDFIQAVMDGELFGQNAHASALYWAGVLALVVVAKCFATSLTVGSGAAGGVLGPAVFVGGATGAFLGLAFEAALPGSFPDPLRQGMIAVGMGGVLAATMRIPIAAIIMVTEMTGSYHLIVPSMLVCITAYVVGRRWGLNQEQVPTSAQSPVHAADAIIHLLETWRVKSFLQPAWTHVVSSATHLNDIVAKIEPGTQPVFAVVDEGRLCGLISLPDLDPMHRENPLLDHTVIAADIMTERITTLRPDDNLYQALELFRLENHHVLPVVEPVAPHRWLGMLTRGDVYHAVAEKVNENRRFILEEYAGLIAIDQQVELDNLLKAVAPRSDVRVERLMIPTAALGLSIRQCDFRNRFGANVIALELPDGTLQSPPDLDLPLESFHRLRAIVDRRV